MPHIVSVQPNPIEYMDITVKVKKDGNVEKEKFDELAEWFKGRFDDIKTVTRVVREDKAIKDADGEPTGVVRKGGIFTTVLLKDGRAGVVTVQDGSEDNAELGVLWAYTKAKEQKPKNDIQHYQYNINEYINMWLSHRNINPCSEIPMGTVRDNLYVGYLEHLLK
jgi:hypothetical protein